MANTVRMRGARWPRLALRLAAALIMVLGLCPAVVLAKGVEVEVEPRGTVPRGW